MGTWFAFAGALVFYGIVLTFLFDDASDWFDEQEHELLLDELWNEDDLAESC